MNNTNKIVIAITEASFSGNKGAAAMIQSSVQQLKREYGEKLCVLLFSVWPKEDQKLAPDGVEIISARVGQQVFVAFPLAILYWLFKGVKPVRSLLLKNHILAGYDSCDLVLDEAGVSFVDSRGFVMNTFAFICMAIPLLLGKNVVKYSQAMGSFDKKINRLQAKIILSKMKLIVSRGKITSSYLDKIGITKNVVLCADGAFSMDVNPLIANEVDAFCRMDDFFSDRPIVGISPSTVVKKKCKKCGIDYVDVLTTFINSLMVEGYNILILANSARVGKKRERNNDLLLCEAIYDRFVEKDHIRFYKKEMSPDEIISFLGKCRFVVASRFHAMVFSLKRKKPVLLIGWSHKYEEVLNYFQLGKYATDYQLLSDEKLLDGFHSLVENEKIIEQSLNENLEKVINSSYDNIRYTVNVINELKL